MQVSESRCDELSLAMDDVNIKLSLWQGQPEFTALTAAWADTQFEKLDVLAMEEAVAKFHKMVFRMEKGLPPNPLVPKFRAMVDEYRNLIPCVQSLRNKCVASPASNILTPHHPTKASRVLCVPCFGYTKFPSRSAPHVPCGIKVFEWLQTDLLLTAYRTRLREREKQMESLYPLGSGRLLMFAAAFPSLTTCTLTNVEDQGMY
jgi:hypothetical protein